MMPLMEHRRAPEAGGGNLEARIREREASRQEGCSLFGRQGMLSELAQLQMPQMPMAGGSRENLTGVPGNGAVRAAERRAAKEARVQAILEERDEQERLASDLGGGLRKCRLSSGSTSAPVLPAAGACSLSLGSLGTDKLAPEEMERQKLRVACKMETLAFLNGYHNAVGKMTPEQKATLLAQLHQGKSKAVKPRAGPCVPADGCPERSARSERSEHSQRSERSEREQCSGAAQPAFRTMEAGGEAQQPAFRTVEAEEESAWGCPQDFEGVGRDEGDEEEEEENELEEPSVHQRLQQVNDICNQAFVPEAIDFDAFDLESEL